MQRGSRAKAERRRLKREASEALKRGRPEKALAHYRSLARREPSEPEWPQRIADVCRRLSRRGEELEALLRAAELYAERGFAIRAVAACRMILAIDPTHTDALERMMQLQAQRGIPLPGTRRSSSPASGARTRARAADAPLEELLLTEVVPGARPARMADATLEGVAEIPLGASEEELTLGPVSAGVAPGPPPAAPEPEGDDDADALFGTPEDLDLLAQDRERPPFDAEVDELDVRQEEEAAEALSRTPLFGALDARSLRRMIEGVRVVDLVAGQRLFREGDPSGALYVVVEGAVVPIAEGEVRRKLAVIEEGDFFGEIGLVTNQPRTATIEALVDSRCLCIDREVVWSLVDEEPEVLGVLLRFLRERLIGRLVQTSPIFAPFARSERSALAQRFRFLEISDGSAVIEQGQSAEALFVLLAGQLEVVHADRDGRKVLATLSPGDVFGEMSLLYDEPALAAVVARGKCWALAMPAGTFRKLRERYPALEEGIARIAAERHRQNWDTFRKARHRDGRVGGI